MRYPYSYTFEVTNLAAGQSVAPKIELDRDTDFVAEEVAAVAYEVLTGITKAAEVMPLCLVNFKPSASDAGVFDKPAPLANVAGTGEFPRVMRMPVRWKGNTSPVMEITNFSSDKTYAKVFVTLHGYREDGN